MPLKLYMTESSPPVRSVRMLAKSLGLDLDLIPMDFKNQEHLSDWYLKLNSQHTIPTLIDEEGRVIWDSHAINIYLIETYGKGSTLYPQDAYKKALVNQKLHFDSEVIFALLKTIARSIMYEGGSLTSVFREKANIAYGHLETFLVDKKWVTGDQVTLADISLLTSVTSLDVFVPIDQKFINIKGWINRAKETLPYYDVNEKGLSVLKEVMVPFLEKK